METMNNLKHTIATKDIDGNNLFIKIRLSDDCKNGHNDFAITCDCYEKGKPKTDKYYLYGGCGHDEILKVRPDLKIFVDLHLCDFRGVPMHAVENGFDHLENSKPEVAQGYVRATNEEFAVLKQAKDKLYFSHLLFHLGIVQRWQKEANEAIALLEGMTGQKFNDNSTRLTPVPTDISEVGQKIADGYYTPEKILERERQKAIDGKLKSEKEVLEECNKRIEKAKRECAVKLSVLQAGLPLDNSIYYDHSNELAFNWLELPKGSDTGTV